MTSALIPLHMGSLHAYEQWLVVAIAFGPFLILGLVIAMRRRQDLAEESKQSATVGSDAGETTPGPTEADEAP